MKITIYELLGLIKDGKAPKKIIYKSTEYTYEDIGYYNKQRGYLFDGYYTEGILDDEVQILETTLNIKDMNITSKKIEKLYYCEKETTNEDTIFLIKQINFMVDKINEIIDVLNNNK